MSKNPDDNAPLDANLIEAYSITLAHHAEVVRIFAANFVNTFALFNAGAFAACVSIIPTDTGKRLLAEHQYLSIWTIILFSLGFFTSIALMSVLFGFSLRKYRHYRDILKTARYSTPPNDRVWFHVVAFALLGLTSFTTVVAAIISVALISLVS